MGFPEAVDSVMMAENGVMMPENGVMMPENGVIHGRGWGNISRRTVCHIVLSFV
jgi:hypothetical protein